MEFSAKQIAEFIDGEVVGDLNVKVHAFAKIEEGIPGAISFLSNSKYNHYLYSTHSSIVLVNTDFIPEGIVSTTLIKVKNAYESIAKLLSLVEASKPKKRGIDPLASISPTATIGKNVYIGPFVTIGDYATIGNETVLHPHVCIGDKAQVGSNCTLFPHTTIYADCIVGNRCTLHAGVVIGSDGFGFAPTATGFNKIPQIGNVLVEDDVEIGANTCIDRATMGSTHIKQGVKLDNLIQIGHNVEIGEHTVIASQAGIAGSTKLGKWCMIGGQVGFAGHLQIGNKVNIGAQSGVGKNVPDGASILGSPAYEMKEYARSLVLYKKLPAMDATLFKLESEIEKLKNQPIK